MGFTFRFGKTALQLGILSANFRCLSPLTGAIDHGRSYDGLVLAALCPGGCAKNMKAAASKLTMAKRANAIM